MSENTRLAAWRFFWIFGVLAIVETSVRVGWISTFFLAARPRGGGAMGANYPWQRALVDGDHAL